MVVGSSETLLLSVDIMLWLFVGGRSKGSNSLKLISLRR